MNIEIIKPIMPKALLHLYRKFKFTYDYTFWILLKKPIPPPHIVKQKIIKKYKNLFKYNILIETGTFKGGMIEAQKRNFNKIYSIELSRNYYEKAQQRFHKDKNIYLINGDSGIELRKLMRQIKEPAIFWLDGHYSGGNTAKGEIKCPILKEIEAIFSADQFNHVILIDDARCFTGEDDFPSINELDELMKIIDPLYRLEIKNDVIRCTKPYVSVKI